MTSAEVDSRVVTWKWMKRFSEAKDDAVIKLLTQIVKDAKARDAALEQRVAELEAQLRDRPGMKYCGVHDTTTVYHPGDVVTYAGSMWVARETIIGAAPGDGARGWQLAVKRGRDAR